MANKTILVLGGYGQTGMAVAALLLEHADVEVVLAGRSKFMAEEAAVVLKGRFPGNSVTAREADASDPASLAEAFQGIDLVVVCSSTTRYCKQVAGAVLEAGADYLDVLFPTHVVATMREQEPRIREAGRCFVTQGGCHPGLPAAMLRHARPRFVSMTGARVSGFMHMEMPRMSGSAAELLEETAGEPCLVWERGSWRKAGWKDARKVNFGPPFGIKDTWPIFLEEMRDLPREYGLEEADVQMGGFTSMDTWVTFPLALMLAKIHKGLGAKTLGRFMVWNGRHFTKPPWLTLFRLEVDGTDGSDDEMTGSMDVSHADAYVLTAAPVVACLLQVLDGTIEPGLHLQALAVDTPRFFDDLRMMDVDVQDRVLEEQ